MVGLEKLVKELLNADVLGEIWVDGSFLTEQIDPHDVDILLHVDADFYNKVTSRARSVIDWVGSNLKATHKVDSYLWLEHQRPPSHPDYWSAEWERAYWIRQFGWSREDEVKGMAVLILRGTTAP